MGIWIGLILAGFGIPIAYEMVVGIDERAIGDAIIETQVFCCCVKIERQILMSALGIYDNLSGV
jgi:hypothetical protein